MKNESHPTPLVTYGQLKVDRQGRFQAMYRANVAIHLSNQDFYSGGLRAYDVISGGDADGRER